MSIMYINSQRDLFLSNTGGLTMDDLVVGVCEVGENELVIVCAW